jgi:hypothetical protein
VTDTGAPDTDAAFDFDPGAVSDTGAPDTNAADTAATDAAFDALLDDLSPSTEEFDLSDDLGAAGETGASDEERAFQEKLEGELQSAMLLEQDIVLLAAEYGEETQAEDMPLLREELFASAAEFWKREDLVFASSDGVLFVIVPDTDLESALSSAREFHNEIAAQNEEEAASPQLRAQQRALFIGFTARQGRNVDAARLFREAKGALRRAREDPAQPITAFRIDQKKWEQLEKKLVKE